MLFKVIAYWITVIIRSLWIYACNGILFIMKVKEVKHLFRKITEVYLESKLD